MELNVKVCGLRIHVMSVFCCLAGAGWAMPLSVYPLSIDCVCHVLFRPVHIVVDKNVIDATAGSLYSTGRGKANKKMSKQAWERQEMEEGRYKYFFPYILCRLICTVMKNKFLEKVLLWYICIYIYVIWIWIYIYSRENELKLNLWL